ncbi:hypothetical protein BGZ63DRAFT_401249 [Mariannaea sp. PMI_226]|nr:hypothetical protein BGZ63DRAFT_401249 [Mariannaea sp. PMI_226]
MKSKRARETAEPEGSKNNDHVQVEEPSKKRKRTGDEDVSDVKTAKKEKKEKKDKKDKKDKHKKESRKERKEKRKDLQALPEQDDDEMEDAATPTDEPPAATAAGPADAEKSEKRDKKKEKKDKKDKKDKKAKQELQDTDTATAAKGEEDSVPSTDKKQKKKKEKKEKKASKDKPTTADPDADADADTTAAAAADDAGDADTSSGKADRHIVFVGNLPFSATADTIKAHFASLSPASVRCMSDPNSDKPCRGIAFVEFSKVWHMRTCLDKFHHSMFNDGVSPPRRINVELTAGGGGKTKNRQEKIREKNRKLDENRTKRIEREKTAKEENRANGNSATQQYMEDSVHPSRRGFVPEH